MPLELHAACLDGRAFDPGQELDGLPEPEPIDLFRDVVGFPPEQEPVARGDAEEGEEFAVTGGGCLCLGLARVDLGPPQLELLVRPGARDPDRVGLGDVGLEVDRRDRAITYRGTFGRPQDHGPAFAGRA